VLSVFVASALLAAVAAMATDAGSAASVASGPGLDAPVGLAAAHAQTGSGWAEALFPVSALVAGASLITLLVAGILRSER
jgi:hypothetical protein